MSAPPRRLVLMRFDTDADAQRVREAHTSFESIPGVSCVEAVVRALVHDEGAPYTHVSLFEFADSASRAAYHDHPAHVGAREAVRGLSRDVVVIDVG
jgi:hypothetical protein